MSDGIQELQTKLKSSGYSLTKPRTEVFLALQNQEPQTMRALIDHLPFIDRASIYRTIDLFKQLGIVQQLQVGWKYKLELSDEFSHHHHHITCDKCHNIVAFDEDESLEALLNTIAEKAQYSITGHQIEIRGICQNCAT